jgi:hypothetical protein
MALLFCKSNNCVINEEKNGCPENIQPNPILKCYLFRQKDNFDMVQRLEMSEIDLLSFHATLNVISQNIYGKEISIKEGFH